jgi:hypothetical protein
MGSVLKHPLSVQEIEAWATRYRETTGKWPGRYSGEIPGPFGESWATVDAALREGRRGFPGGSSLAQFLAEKYGTRGSACIWAIAAA